MSSQVHNPEKGSIVADEDQLDTTHNEQRAPTDDADNDDDDDDFAWDSNVILNLTALYLIYFSSTWAMGIPSGSIAYIMREYPGEFGNAAWIAAAPSFALCVISLFIGDMSDIFGRKIFLVTGAGLGVVGMLLGGCATSLVMIIGAQVFNGIALTLGYLATPLLAEAVPKRSRATVVGGGTFLVGVASMAGGVSQGAFMKHGVVGLNKGWRVGFYLGACFFFLSLVFLVLFYHPSPRPNPEGYSLKQRVLKIDWLGILMGSAGFLLVLLGLEFGGQRDPWTSARVLAILIVGVVLLVAFGLWEWKGVREGLFPKSLFQHSNYGVSVVLNFAEGVAIFSAQAYMSQIILQLLTDDMILAAVYNFPLAVGMLLGVTGAAVIASKTREAKWIAMGGCVCLLLGGGLLAVVEPGINMAAWVIPSGLVGGGVGSLGVILPVISSLCTPNRYIATSVSICTSARGLGGAVGVVIFTQIFTSKLSQNLPRQLTEAALAAGVLPADLGDLLVAWTSHSPELSQIPGVTPEVLGMLRSAEDQAYADSYRFIWYAMIPFTAVALFISFFLKSTKEQMTLQVASRVQPRHARQEDERSNKLEGLQ